jgi:hypothetical protein
MPTESPQAYRAFVIYRDLGPGQRSLAAVSRALAAERRGSALQIISGTEGAERALKEHRKKSGRIGLWSGKFRWQERAAAWDSVVDAHLRQRQLDAIAAMAENHAENARLALEMLMAPVLEFQRALEDPERRAALDNLETLELFKLCVAAARQLPLLQQAERLARGCKIVDSNPMSNPASTQGGHEWRIVIYQPPQPEGLPSLERICNDEPDEWEEAGQAGTITDSYTKASKG